MQSNCETCLGRCECSDAPKYSPGDNPRISGNLAVWRNHSCEWEVKKNEHGNWTAMSRLTKPQPVLGLNEQESFGWESEQEAAEVARGSALLTLFRLRRDEALLQEITRLQGVIEELRKELGQ